MSEVLLLDIEGTVCPIAFVHDTLFPYARERLAEWVAANPDDPVLAEVGPDPVRRLHGWMDADEKITPLKAIQGRIWRQGFEEGVLVAPMYEDVRPVIEAWVAANRRVAVYSSGSIEAQKLLFGWSSQGDLARWVAAWFDTTTGPKREAASYTAIARDLGVPPADVLFCSDVVEELDAADAAGMACRWIVRDEAPATRWPAHRSLPSP